MKRAFVLIAVLSAISVTSVVVSEIYFSTFESAKSLERIKSIVQADIICDTALEVVKVLLREEDKVTGRRIDWISEDLTSPEEIWSKTYLFPIDILWGHVVVWITDEMGKLNVNSLADSRGRRGGINRIKYPRIFERFFRIMGFNPALAGYIADWQDMDRSGLELPNARNWFFSYPEELLFVARQIGEDLSPIFLQWYEGRPDAMSSPFLTFWPKAGVLRINVNTAPPQVIMATSDKMDENIVREIVAKRRQEPFRTTAEFVRFISRFGLTKNDFFGLNPYEIFDVKSNYFSVRIFCTVGDVQRGIQAVLMRGAKEEVLFFRRF